MKLLFRTYRLGWWPAFNHDHILCDKSFGYLARVMRAEPWK